MLLRLQLRILPLFLSSSFAVVLVVVVVVSCSAIVRTLKSTSFSFVVVVVFLCLLSSLKVGRYCKCRDLVFIFLLWFIQLHCPQPSFNINWRVMQRVNETFESGLMTWLSS